MGSGWTGCAARSQAAPPTDARGRVVVAPAIIPLDNRVRCLSGAAIQSSCTRLAER